ncbi:MAG: type II toxin-antitoxin system RelE/ParE family toxin [Deltaproteobacteria bacterium]|nr:type II toxin-antitoxin system RelE/ParE family toxin [Deltaproteobacteria bacterium]
MRLSLRQRAELDIHEAYDWYESRQSGLGDMILRSVDACFARLCREPEICSICYDRVRAARLHRFPYSVFYVIRSDHVDVLSVYHGRRRPRRFEP